MYKNLARVRRSRSKVKGHGHQGQKNRKTAESSAFTMHTRACAVDRTHQAATDDTIAWPPRGDGLRRWENQRISFCLVLMKINLLLYCAVLYSIVYCIALCCVVLACMWLHLPLGLNATFKLAKRNAKRTVWAIFCRCVYNWIY